MTDELWADVGRRTNALADELTELGWSVTIRFDRPHDRVDIIIRPADG